MSLQSRLSALITAVGADIKELKARTPTILSAGQNSLSDTEQPTYAIEWRDDSDDSLQAKLAAVNPIESSVIVDRTDLRIRVKSRTGGASVDRLILDSNGLTTLTPPFVTALPTEGPGANGALVDGQECIYLPDPSNANGNGGVAWHLKYRAAETGAYKWYCVGGTPFITPYDAADNADLASSSYVALISTPAFTAPRPGVYRVAFGHGSFHTVAGGVIWMGPSANGVAPTDGQDTVVSSYSGTTDQYQIQRETNVTVTTAGHVINLHGKTTTPTGRIRYPWMAIMPVRVG